MKITDIKVKASKTRRHPHREKLARLGIIRTAAEPGPLVVAGAVTGKQFDHHLEHLSPAAQAF